MWQRFKSIRSQLEHDLGSTPERRYFSPMIYSHYNLVLPLILRYVRGKVIDLGCGYAPFKVFLEKNGVTYHTLDLQPKLSEVTYVGDIQDMSPIVESASYDSIICLEVLEHVPEPYRAIQEMYRILKPGGVGIISAPHISRLHDEPHDYYRFTHYGLRYMLEKAGFELLEVHKKGELLSFLGHQISTFLLTVTWSMPGVRDIVWLLNKWFITKLLYNLDKMLMTSGIFAVGYVVVVRKF